MGFQDFVSEVEASTLVGVSGATLSRFAEAGYLHMEVDSDGLKMFSKAELASVFSVDIPGEELSSSSRSSHRSSQGSMTSSSPTRGDTEMVAPSSPEAYAPPAPTSPLPSSPASSSPASASPASSVAIAPASSNNLLSAHSAPIQQHSSPAEQWSTAGGIRAEAQATPAPQSQTVATTEQGDAARYERELTRFRHLVDMQERLLDVYEQQIKDMRRERDWLRQRVERHEEKHDRDQLLLLSETQTIRKLVAHNEQRKSSLQYALEWFGFTSSPATTTGSPHRQRLAATIERSPSSATRPVMSTPDDTVRSKGAQTSERGAMKSHSDDAREMHAKGS